MPQQFQFKVSPGQEEGHDVQSAIAMWQLSWADKVVLGDIEEEDGDALVTVFLSDGWETGPPDLVAWARAKLLQNP